MFDQLYGQIPRLPHLTPSITRWGLQLTGALLSEAPLARRSSPLVIHSETSFKVQSDSRTTNPVTVECPKMVSIKLGVAMVTWGGVRRAGWQC